MDVWHIVASVLAGGGGVGLVGYLALQVRLAKRDRRDHELRMAALQADPKAPVLENLPELRRAEREVSILLPKRKADFK